MEVRSSGRDLTASGGRSQDKHVEHADSKRDGVVLTILLLKWYRQTFCILLNIAMAVLRAIVCCVHSYGQFTRACSATRSSTQAGNICLARACLGGLLLHQLQAPMMAVPLGQHCMMLAAGLAAGHWDLWGLANAQWHMGTNPATSPRASYMPSRRMVQLHLGPKGSSELHQAPLGV